MTSMEYAQRIREDRQKAVHEIFMLKLSDRTIRMAQLGGLQHIEKIVIEPARGHMGREKYWQKRLEERLQVEPHPLGKTAFVEWVFENLNVHSLCSQCRDYDYLYLNL